MVVVRSGGKAIFQHDGVFLCGFGLFHVKQSMGLGSKRRSRSLAVLVNVMESTAVSETKRYLRESAERALRVHTQQSSGDVIDGNCRPFGERRIALRGSVHRSSMFHVKQGKESLPCEDQSHDWKIG